MRPSVGDTHGTPDAVYLDMIATEIETEGRICRQPDAIADRLRAIAARMRRGDGSV